jgi:hypothetical protein
MKNSWKKPVDGDTGNYVAAVERCRARITSSREIIPASL